MDQVTRVQVFFVVPDKRNSPSILWYATFFNALALVNVSGSNFSNARRVLTIFPPSVLLRGWSCGMEGV